MNMNTVKPEELTALSQLLITAVSNRSGSRTFVPDGISGSTPGQMLPWLNLLNLATTPSALRLALQAETDTVRATALLPFLVAAGLNSAEDRDKVDLLVTWLATKWHSDPTSEDGQAAVYANLKSLLDVATQAEPLEQEPCAGIAKLRHFGKSAAAAGSIHELVTSGIYKEARLVKEQVSHWFFHPQVLAAIAAWNLTFGAALERVFLQGVARIGLSDVGNLLRGAEFFMAPDANEELGLMVGLTASSGTRQTSGNGPGVKVMDNQGGVPAGGKAEISNIHDMEVTIRNHVLAETPSEHSRLVQLTDYELTLSPAEWESFRASYFDEQSFRGECARTFASLVSVFARLSIVLSSYKRKEHSSHLWHADAECLQHLVPIADKMLSSTKTVVEIAEARGLYAKLGALQGTRYKLQEARDEAERELGKRNMRVAADAAAIRVERPPQTSPVAAVH
jgi:hypothetical protein